MILTAFAPVRPVNPGSPGGADTMGMEIHRDVSDSLLLGPAGHDLFGSLLADARDDRRNSGCVSMKLRASGPRVFTRC